MKVLIIEDEPKVRRALKRLLLEIDPAIESIREAETGVGGLDAVRNEEPDLIVLDMIMPVMNGNELLERLRERKLDIPVIVVSGHNDFGYVKQALANEAVDYVLKPFDREDVEAALAKAKERIGKNRFREQTERLWEEMKREKSQLRLASVLDNVYEGRKLSREETERLPAFVREDLCQVHVIAIADYEYALRERFNKDKQLLNYAIGKLIAEHAESVDLHLLFGPSGRYDWSYWLTVPASVSSGEWVKELLDALGQVLKLKAFALSDDLGRRIADFSSAIAALEDSAFYADLRSLELGTAIFPNGQANRQASSPELLAAVDAFVPKACHLIKHGLPFRIRGELERLFGAATASGRLSAMFLFQAWTLLLARVETEFGLRCAADLLDGVEPFATRIDFDGARALDLFEETLQSFVTDAAYLAESSTRGNRALAVKEYIDIGFREEMSLADLAERFFMSKEYLAFQFKRQFGVTVVRYIHTQRLDEARRMLEEDDRSVSAIASAVGYDHFSYFDKLFKREYGRTPSEYRINSTVRRERS